jgi:hypothetical protein
MTDSREYKPQMTITDKQLNGFGIGKYTRITQLEDFRQFHKAKTVLKVVGRLNLYKLVQSYPLHEIKTIPEVMNRFYLEPDGNLSDGGYLCIAREYEAGTTLYGEHCFEINRVSSHCVVDGNLFIYAKDLYACDIWVRPATLQEKKTILGTIGSIFCADLLLDACKTHEIPIE